MGRKLLGNHTSQAIQNKSGFGIENEKTSLFPSDKESRIPKIKDKHLHLLVHFLQQGHALRLIF